MYERETVNSLDLIIRKLELPEEVDSQLRNSVKASFNIGHNYFIKNMGLELSYPSIWKPWKYLSNLSRNMSFFSGVRNVHNWDCNKLTREIETYINDDKSTGVLTKRLDYLLTVVKPSKEYSREFRKVFAESAVLGEKLVVKNMFPFCKWEGDIYCLVLKTWRENKIEYKLLDEYFNKIKSKEPVTV